VESLSKRILQKTQQAGAEAIVVSCPLCQSNLDIVQKDRSDPPTPIFYVTELLRLSFKDKGDPHWFKMHVADPVPLLTAKGLL
jgi:heterodisulfide reductase subunit B2